MLSLDRWAYHLGLDPRHFNQVTSIVTPVHFCRKVWMQYPWQTADHVGREEVADAISKAEYDIVMALGYYPIPQWIVGEVIRTSPSPDVSAKHTYDLENVAGRYRSVQAAFGHIISGGIEVRDSVGPSAVAWVDATGVPLANDIHSIGLVTTPVTVTDPDELRVYFAGHNGEDEWEIRPLRAVTIIAGVAYILIDRHLLVDPDLWEDLDPHEVNGDLDASFVATVDVYEVYNDASQQAQLQWERLPSTCDCGSTDCAMCAWATQWACLQTRDPKLGFVTYQPGDWDAASESYTAAPIAVARQPERVRLWYRAGYRGARVTRPYNNMDLELERMITLLSICYLDRPVCGCSNVEAFYQRWTEDKALVAETGHYQVTNRDMSCPWGTKIGAIQAWNMAQNYALGRAVRY
jgi:hypothetical protein